MWSVSVAWTRSTFFKFGFQKLNMWISARSIDWYMIRIFPAKTSGPFFLSWEYFAGHSQLTRVLTTYSNRNEYWHMFCGAIYSAIIYIYPAPPQSDICWNDMFLIIADKRSVRTVTVYFQLRHEVWTCRPHRTHQINRGSCVSEWWERDGQATKADSSTICSESSAILSGSLRDDNADSIREQPCSLFSTQNHTVATLKTMYN